MGAVKGMLAVQDTYDCVFSVVDLHAITTPYDPKTLSESTRSVILDYLAAGLDPKKCLLEVQSFIPEHMELAYYLGTIFPLAELEDLPTYKDKKMQHPKYVNMGLLYYPVLMAADILLYKGELVPVGIDQEPHLEIARQIARKFNSVYGETFPEPRRFKTEGEYVPSLTGEGKMSKSVEGSFINLTDDLATIKAKLAKVPTDSGTLGGSIPQKGGVANLFILAYLFGGRELHHKYVEDYKEKKIRYGEMKQELADVLYEQLKPIQEKRREFEENPAVVDAILREHAGKCREIAKNTVLEVKEKMGFLQL
jgi:tryptophanyl-tRNA synthetase